MSIVSGSTTSIGDQYYGYGIDYSLHHLYNQYPTYSVSMGWCKHCRDPVYGSTPICADCLSKALDFIEMSSLLTKRAINAILSTVK